MLAKPDGETEYGRAESLKLERKLYNRLYKNAVQDILHWFDAVMTTEINDGNETIIWQTETTKKAKQFIEKIGMNITKNLAIESGS